MLRRVLALVPLAALCACAGLGVQAPPPAPDPAVEELERSLARLELRIEEVTRNVIALRDRVDAQEAVVRELQARQPRPEPQTPPLKVVKLEPPGAQEPASGAALRDDAPAADLYRKAFNAFREARYGQAILDFEEFLRRYPDHEYADNAQYWIGESYYSQAEYEQAVVEFQKVLDRYPQDAKAPDALVKLGLAYRQLGAPEKAGVFWERAAREYPGTEAARQARKLMGAD